MLLTGLFPESIVKKSVPLSDVSTSLEVSNQDISVKLQLLKKKLHKRQLVIQRRNIEKPLKKRMTILRTFSFPLVQSKNDSDEEMDTPAREIECYSCKSYHVRHPSSATQIWKGDSNCFCMGKDDVSDDDIKSIAESLVAKITANNLTAQEISSLVQDVYNSLGMRLEDVLWMGDISEEMATERINFFEKKLMRNLYPKLFNKIVEEEEASDKNLRSKISCLHWVTVHHLAAKVNESDEEVIELLHKAMLDIATINFKESPAEKLECIMNCSRHIFALLKKHPDSTECADDYLPVLVYIILQVNPSLLHSNIKYILLFSNPERVVKGEEGYYFTHLCSVVSFIENINASSLNMSEEKFERCTTGCLDNERERMLQNRSLASCICKVYNQAAEAEALKKKQDSIMEKSRSLQEEIKLLKEDILKESIRSKISKAEVSKFMASRLERSRTNYSNSPMHLQSQIRDEASQDLLINHPNAIKSTLNILRPNHYVENNQKLSNQTENLNLYCNFLKPETKTIEHILQKTTRSDPIHILVPKDLLSESVEVAFDVESYLKINDLKDR